MLPRSLVPVINSSALWLEVKFLPLSLVPVINSSALWLEVKFLPLSLVPLLFQWPTRRRCDLNPGLKLNGILCLLFQWSTRQRWRRRTKRSGRWPRMIMSALASSSCQYGFCLASFLFPLSSLVCTGCSRKSAQVLKRCHCCDFHYFFNNLFAK